MKRLIGFLILAIICCGSYSAYASGNMLGGWFDGKPVNPPTPTTPPITDPPVQTVTTEYGERKVYSNEVNFHFPKSAEDYGKFKLVVAGKTYVIEGSYKDADIEVRNSQTTGKLVVIAGPAYKDKTATVTYPSTDALTKPGTTPPPVTPPEGEIPLTMGYNHVNQYSLCENEPEANCAVSITLCKGAPNFAEAYLNGVKMREHGDRSKNCDRQMFTNKTWQGKVPHNVEGFIVLVKKDGSKVKVLLKKNADLWHHKGDCFMACGN